jgi:hypothetical protein
MLLGMARSLAYYQSFAVCHLGQHELLVEQARNGQTAVILEL